MQGYRQYQSRLWHLQHRALAALFRMPKTIMQPQQPWRWVMLACRACCPCLLSVRVSPAPGLQHRQRVGSPEQTFQRPVCGTSNTHSSPCSLTRLQPAGSSEGHPPGCEVKISRKTLSKAVGELMKARDMKASRSSCTGHPSSLDI